MFEIIPNEVLYNILRYLTYRQILPLLTCNRDLRNRNYNDFWKKRAYAIYNLDGENLWDNIPRKTGLEKYIWIKENRNLITLVLRCCYLQLNYCSKIKPYDIPEIKLLIDFTIKQNICNNWCRHTIVEILELRLSIFDEEVLKLAAQSTCLHTDSETYDKRYCSSLFCLYIKNELNKQGNYHWLLSDKVYDLNLRGPEGEVGPKGPPGSCSGGPRGYDAEYRNRLQRRLKSKIEGQEIKARR